MTALSISEALALRLADAVRHRGQKLDPVLGGIDKSDELSVAAMQSAINSGAAQSFTELSRLFAAHGPTAELPQMNGWGLQHDWRLGGFALLPQPSGPHLFATTGAMLGIEEALLVALANPTFFMFDGLYDPNDDGLSRDPLQLMRVRLESPGRFHDYSWLQRVKGKNGKIALLTTMPLAPWRLCQFELLRDLTFQWLSLHEAAHWLTGHLGWLSGTGGGVGLCIADPDLHLGASSNSTRVMTDIVTRALKASGAPKFVTPAAARKCIEYQADHLGFHLMEFLQREASHTDQGAFQRYQRAMQSLDLPPFYDEVINLSETSRSRALLVAAGTAMLLVELASQRASGNGTYPHPLGRLLNLQLAAISTWSIVPKFDGDPLLNRTLIASKKFQQFLRESLARSVIDLDVLTNVLGISPLLVKSGPSERVRLAPVVEDLHALLKPDTQLDEFKTEAARELYALYEENGHVASMCEPYGCVDPSKLHATNNTPAL